MKIIIIGMLVLPLILVGCSKEEPPTSSTDSMTEDFQEDIVSKSDDLMKEMTGDEPDSDRNMTEENQKTGQAVKDAMEPAMTNLEQKPGKTMSYDEVVTLAKNSGCLSCHAIDNRKLVGPGWADVAERYRDDPDARDALIKKVKEGGKGSWTDMTGGMSMPPYGLRVTDTNIQILVDFILLL